MQTTFGRYLFRLASALVVVAPAAGLCAPAERGSASNNSMTREDGPASEEVSVADLDLRQPADQNKLKQRIRLAAVRVCDFDGFLSTACVDIASVDALNQAHHLADGNASVGATAATVLIAGPRRR